MSEASVTKRRLERANCEVRSVYVPRITRAATTR
jgi:hypothetical protein